MVTERTKGGLFKNITDVVWGFQRWNSAKPKSKSNGCDNVVGQHASFLNPCFCIHLTGICSVAYYFVSTPGIRVP